jgi:hypothetical protein
MSDLLERIQKEQGAASGRPTPISCAGYWTHNMDGSEFDCEYEHAGEVLCENCVVNGGRMDPRTGKRAGREGAK